MTIKNVLYVLRTIGLERNYFLFQIHTRFAESSKIMRSLEGLFYLVFKPPASISGSGSGHLAWILLVKLLRIFNFFRKGSVNPALVKKIINIRSH